MRVRTRKMLVLGVISLLVPVGVALAHVWVEYTWVNPCVGGLQSQNVGGEWTYWCEADWDGTGIWDYDDGCVPGACPVHPGIHLIEKSNHGTCNGGSNDGNPCSTDSDCPGFQATCEEFESHLEVTLNANETIYGFAIDTESTGATTDVLSVRFIGSGAVRELSATSLIIDGTNGQATMKVGTNADFTTR